MPGALVRRDEVTAGQLRRMPDDGDRLELVQGHLARMPPPGFGHGVIVARIQSALVPFVEAHGLGFVTGETGFRLRRHPDTVRAPDVAFVMASRMPSGRLPVGYFEGAPDVAFEVMSPDDTLRAIEGKVRDYLAAGTHTVCVVRPQREELTVVTADQASLTRREHDVLTLPGLLPGFRLAVKSLFA